MKATFSKLPAPKKRSTSVSSFTYVPIATSSLLSYLFSPTQGCVSAEVQVSYRPKFKEKKKQRVFCKVNVKTGRENAPSNLTGPAALPLPACSAAANTWGRAQCCCCHCEQENPPAANTRQAHGRTPRSL